MSSKVIEQLTQREQFEYAKTCLRARQDPIWFMKEILGWESIFPKQEEIIRKFYQNRYNLSLDEYKELCIICGQRGGKSVLVGNMNAYAFHDLISLDSPSDYYGLMKNQPIAVTCVAARKDTAIDGIFALMCNMLQESEWINHHYDLKYLSEGRIDCLEKHCFAQVKPASSDSIAGGSNIFVSGDEVDLWQNSTTSRVGAQNVFDKLVNSTMTFGNRGKIVTISSLDHVAGMMSKVYYRASQDPTALTYNLCTWEMNPSPDVSEEALRKKFEFDMESFWRYFANRPDVSSNVLFPGGVKLNPLMTNIFTNEMERIAELDERIKNIPRVLAIDPAVKNDSFGMGSGFRKGDHIVIDGAIKFSKPGEKDAFIKPSDIRNNIAHIINELNVIAFVHDTYQYPEILEMVQYDYGLEPIQHHSDTEAYGKWLELQDGASQISLDVVYDEMLKREAEQLVKSKTPQTGKVRIDHPNGGSKDCADTVANCIWYLDASTEELYESFNPVAMVSIL